MSEGKEAPPPLDNSNDQTSFENVSDSSDEDEPIIKAATATAEQPKISLSEAISSATGFKEAGNSAFKRNDFVVSLERYEEGLKVLADYNNETETQAILASLHGNMAMVQLRQEEWSKVVISCGEVLKIENDNVKALFRRGVAHNKGGSLDEAEADLRRVLVLDTTNAAASKELVDVLRKQKEHKQSEKKAFSSMFAKSMYADKEAERHAKAKREEAERQKEQDDWTKSKLDRRSKGLEEQSFEDWKKEIEEERKKDKEKADSVPLPPSPTTTKPKPKVEPQENDEEEYDAEESQIIAETTKKGYCYFRNELSSETKSLIGDITPKVVAEPPPSPAIGQSSTSTGGDSSSEKIAVSSWNTAGTWEERECTQQAKDRLTALCLEAQVSSSDNPAAMTAEGGGLDPSSLSSVLDALSSSGTDKGAGTTAALEQLEIALATLRASVTGATSVTGDAHIVMARGKKRHIYDFNVALEFEVMVEPPSTPGLSSTDNPDTGIKPKRFKGTFTLPEVVPSAESNGAGLEIAISFKKPIPSLYTNKVHKIAEQLKERVTKQIIAFENEFKSM